MEAMELPLGFPNGWVGTFVANDFYDKFKPKEWDSFISDLRHQPANVIQTLTKPERLLKSSKD